MVAPSKNPPKISVQSFARSNEKVTPGNRRVESDRRAARVWWLASKVTAQGFTLLARSSAASAWYESLSSDEVDHWLTYFDRDVTESGELSVRRIPHQVTQELEAANKRECFDGYVIQCNSQHQQYVLLGTLDGKYCPVVAWYPTKSPIPSRHELKELFEAEEEKNLQREAAMVRRQQKETACQERLRCQIKRFSRIYWSAAWTVLGTMILTAAFFSVRWGAASLFAALIGAWLVYEANDVPARSVAAARKTLTVSLAILVLVVGSFVAVASLATLL
jgi:hypothetical protein